MLLDVVLGDQHHYWLGTEKDKVGYLQNHDRSGDKLANDVFPKLVYGAGQSKTIRYFPDKLPIGIEKRDGRRLLFVYLVDACRCSRRIRSGAPIHGNESIGRNPGEIGPLGQHLTDKSPR